MSKKWTESKDQTMKGSSLVGQEQDGARCAKVTSASATALHSIPVDILGHVLRKAIILEAKDLKLAKNTWKRKADSAISRLKTVCSKWSWLITDVFRIEVHRILDSFAHIRIVLEVVDGLQMSLDRIPLGIATNNDELYLLCCFRDLMLIHVYNRNNLRELKDVVELADFEIHRPTIAACNLSNCIYILGIGKQDTTSVLRIVKDEEQQFHISPWIMDLPLQNRFISVSANGSLILSRSESPDELVSVYNADGSLQHQMRLSLGLFRVSSIIPKSNGNLVLNTFNYEFKRKLTEIDKDGNIVHQYQSSLMGSNVSPADSCDRILIVDRDSRIELLDSELNLLDVTLPKKPDSVWEYPHFSHYDRLRNEVLIIDYVNVFGNDCTISTFKFREKR